MGDELTERIIGAAIEVHRIVGPGLLEKIYEEALSHEFDLRGIRYERQVEMAVEYKGKNCGIQRTDLIVEQEAIVELKIVAKNAGHKYGADAFATTSIETTPRSPYQFRRETTRRRRSPHFSVISVPSVA
jgi:GxxExxY protein